MKISLPTLGVMIGCGLAPLMAADPKPEKPSTTRLPEVVVTADRYEVIRQELWKTPGGVELLTAPEIAKTRGANLHDVFAMTPGVFAQPRQGSADESMLSIRGSGLHNSAHLKGVRLFLDGMNQSGADGFNDFDAIELLALDHIEVYKGANGLAYGGSSLGGGINFVSKTGYTASPFQVRTETGSFGFVKGQISSGQNFPNGTDYYASVTAQREDGFRQHQDLERERFYGNLGWKALEDTDLRFYMVAVNSRNELGGSLTKSQLQLAPGSAAATSLSLNTRRDMELLRPAVSAVHQLDPDQRLEMNTYYQWKDLDHPLAFAFIDNEFNDAGIELRYINTTPLCDHENEFVAGVTPQYGRILDSQYANVLGSRGRLLQSQVDETYNMGVWVQNALKLMDETQAVAGTRLDWSSRQLTDRFLSNGNQSGEVNYTGFSPRLGLIHAFTPLIQAFGNLSMAYEPPTFQEQVLSGNSGLVNLAPQKSYQVEVGTRGKWERADWDLSIYHAELEDELFQNTQGNTGISALSNIARSRHTGVEIGCGYKLWDGVLENDSDGSKRDFVKLSTTYMWSDFRIRTDGPYGGKRVPGMPENHWVSKLTYQHPVGFHYAFHVETTPDAYFVDKANTLQNDGYTVFGMEAGMQFKNGLRLFAELRNITDVTYASAVSTLEIATPGSAQFKSADGFAIYGGIEWKY